VLLVLLDEHFEVVKCTRRSGRRSADLVTVPLLQARRLEMSAAHLALVLRDYIPEQEGARILLVWLSHAVPNSIQNKLNAVN
jgi:hypothetical protein